MTYVRTGLLVTFSLTTAAVVAACSGGNGNKDGVAPCCAATGVTEAPPSAFAGAVSSAASAGRFAQPIAFVPSTAGEVTCITPSATGIVLPEFETLGKAERIDETGAYEVEIEEGGAGRRVIVRVFDRDSDGNETDRGVAALAALPVVNPDGPAIPVSPIRFGAPNKLGESSLELAIFCQMENAAELQNLSFNDVRALVTSGFASAYSGVDDVENAITFAGRYRHAINGLVNLDTSNRIVLAQLREEADALVDACRSPEPPAGLNCTSDGRAEFYRYWHLARRVDDADFDLPIPLVRSIRDHFQALAQDMSDAITDPLAGSAIPDARTMELFRENHRLRLEIAAAAIESAATCFGAGATDPDGDGVCEGGLVDAEADIDTGRGMLSISDLFEEIRTGIASATNEDEIQTLWTIAAEDIVQNFGVQSGVQPVPDFDNELDNVFFAARDGHQPAAQFAITTTASHLQIAGTLFDPGVTGTGTWEAIALDVGANFNTMPPADQQRVTDIVFYATANGTDLNL